MRTTKVRTSLCPGVAMGYMYEEIVDIYIFFFFFGGGGGVITRLNYFFLKGYVH